MATGIDRVMREQLLDRKHKLRSVLDKSSSQLEERDFGLDKVAASGRIRLLLQQVDAALAKIDNGSYGLCETCHDTIECDRLMADPLARFCLDHLTGREKSALERDLELAAQVQRGLLPRQPFESGGWQIGYHYEPAGLVSGDYCDVIDAGNAGFYFMVGDVSGKGIAASMLTAHLHAMFRALVPLGLPLKTLLEHGNRVFCESTLPSHYATLVCGHASPDGRIEIANAGHPSPLVMRGGNVTLLDNSGLPFGMFCVKEFPANEIWLNPGQHLLIYSDGVPEATGVSSEEYGLERLHRLGVNCYNDGLALLAACREDLAAFRQNAVKADDVTLFVLSRTSRVKNFQTDLLQAVC